MLLREILQKLVFYFVARDPVIIERSNLVNISKLIVKELIETSLKYGRMLDSDHMPLQHFFIVLEHVLRHGLRPKKVKKIIIAVLVYIFWYKNIIFTWIWESFRDYSAPKRSCGIFFSWSRSIVQKHRIWPRVSATCLLLGTRIITFIVHIYKFVNVTFKIWPGRRLLQDGDG